MKAPARFAPSARADLAQILDDLRDNPGAGRRLRAVLAEAAGLIGERPAMGRREPKLADANYRFWSLRGFPYLLVYRPDTRPPSILRVVHTSRDLPRVLTERG